MPKALDLKAEIEKLGSVDEAVRRMQTTFPTTSPNSSKGMEGDAPRRPQRLTRTRKTTTSKALDLIGDQPEIHCVEGTELHDLMKASSGHKYRVAIKDLLGSMGVCVRQAKQRRPRLLQRRILQARQDERG